MAVSLSEIFRRIDFADFIRGTFTRNLKLKVLSLALAFVLWMYIQTETIEQVVLTNVEVTVRVASGMEADPAKIKIDRLFINAPKNQVQNLNSDSPRGEIRINLDQPGEYEVKSNDFSWPGLRHYRGMQVEPNFKYLPTKVRVIRPISKWVTVLPKIDAKSLAPGMLTAATRANPQDVMVFGSEAVLNRIDSVETEEAKITETCSEPTEVYREVRIKTPPGVRCETVVKIITTLRPADVQRKLENLDIALQRNPSDLNMVELKPQKVTLTFSGPKTDVENLSNANVTVYLDLRKVDKAGEYKLPVQLNMPKGVSLVGNPPEITVVIKITG
jgi:YbbR domain-containing protein